MAASSTSTSTARPLRKTTFLGRPDHNEALHLLADARSTTVGEEYRSAVEAHVEANRDVIDAASVAEPGE